MDAKFSNKGHRLKPRRDSGPWTLLFIYVVRKGYGSIAHEAKPNGLLTRDSLVEGEGSNCFSISQLLGQKRQQQSWQMQGEEIFIWE